MIGKKMFTSALKDNFNFLQGNIDDHSWMSDTNYRSPSSYQTAAYNIGQSSKVSLRNTSIISRYLGAWERTF
jgi:hypothetical protein